VKKISQGKKSREFKKRLEKSRLTNWKSTALPAGVTQESKEKQKGKKGKGIHDPANTRNIETTL